jgi:hypothetical protein
MSSSNRTGQTMPQVSRYTLRFISIREAVL